MYIMVTTLLHIHANLNMKHKPSALDSIMLYHSE